jgi:hypothetical protein
MIEGVWEKVKLEPHIHMKGWELIGDTSRWCIVVKIGGVTSGWFVVCIGDEVEDRSMVAHDEVNR